MRTGHRPRNRSHNRCRNTHQTPPVLPDRHGQERAPAQQAEAERLVPRARPTLPIRKQHSRYNLPLGSTSADGRGYGGATLSTTESRSARAVFFSHLPGRSRSLNPGLGSTGFAGSALSFRHPLPPFFSRFTKRPQATNFLIRCDFSGVVSQSAQSAQAFPAFMLY